MFQLAAGTLLALGVTLRAVGTPPSRHPGQRGRAQFTVWQRARHLQALRSKTALDVRSFPRGVPLAWFNRHTVCDEYGHNAEVAPDRMEHQ
jgi:hypothetical protein